MVVMVPFVEGSQIVVVAFQVPVALDVLELLRSGVLVFVI